MDDVLTRPGSRALLLCADLHDQLAGAEALLARCQATIAQVAALARAWQQAGGDDEFATATRVAGAELADALSGEDGWGSWMRAALAARISGLSPPPG